MIHNIILILVILLSLIYIEYTYITITDTKIKPKKELPSCKYCKKELTDFCKKDFNCQTENCQKDPLCNNTISYVCTHKDFDCNPHTCRDYYEYEKNPKWGCYNM